MQEDLPKVPQKPPGGMVYCFPEGPAGVVEAPSLQLLDCVQCLEQQANVWAQERGEFRGGEWEVQGAPDRLKVATASGANGVGDCRLAAVQVEAAWGRRKRMSLAVESELSLNHHGIRTSAYSSSSCLAWCLFHIRN